MPTARWFDRCRHPYRSIDAKSTEPMRFDCEHTVGSGLGRLISHEGVT